MATPIEQAARALLELSRESDGLVKWIVRNRFDEPMCVVIAIYGVPEAGAILEAVEAVESQWHA